LCRRALPAQIRITANDDLPFLKAGQILIGFGEPLTSIAQVQELATRGVSYFSMELVPRITRAQAMDALLPWRASRATKPR